MVLKTGYSPRCKICSNYLVFEKHNSYFVVIEPLRKRRSSDCVSGGINLVPVLEGGVN